MTPTTRFSTIAGALLGIALAVLTPSAALAQAGECNGFINISYPSFPAAPLLVPPATEFDMEINLGTGSITGGAANVLIIDSFRLSLGCNADFPLIPTCEPDGPPNFPPAKVEFVSMIQPTCGASTFTPSLGGPGNNEVTFTADMPVVIPANQSTLPGFCSVRFRLRALQGFSSDAVTPNDIEQTVRYNIALCDNGVLVSGGAQTSSIPVMAPLGNPFIGYEAKVQGLTANLGGTIAIPLLGLVQPLPPTDKVTLRRLLLPAAPGNPQGTHLAAYSGFPLPQAGGRKVMVTTTEFGQVTDKLGRRSFVLIDANKSLVGPVAPAPMDRVFACYGYDGRLPGPIAWTDQFGPGSGGLRGRNRLCFPADLNGAAGAVAPLLCVRSEKNQLGPMYQQKVWIGTAWGPSDSIQLHGVDEYCAEVTQITVFP
jgi:hypothetical protein